MKEITQINLLTGKASQMSSSSMIGEIIIVCRILILVLVVVTIFPRFVSVIRVRQLRAENCLGGRAGHRGGGGEGSHVR